MLMKQPRDSVVNLSDCELDSTILEIFSLGMNCHLQSKIDVLDRKAQIEKLYENIKENEKSGTVRVTDEAALKNELERFGMKKMHPNKDLLTKEQ
jgi:hypothetical protein